MHVIGFAYEEAHAFVGDVVAQEEVYVRGMAEVVVVGYVESVQEDEDIVGAYK